jgi:large subunit ribosomal protein L17
MIRNLVIGLFEHGKIITSPAKAKEARPFAEKLITMAKSGSLADRRRAISALHNKGVVAHLFSDIGPRYEKRAGGYSRILHLDRHRIGDAGDMCLFELVEEEIKSKKSKKTTRAKAAVVTEDVASKDENSEDSGSEESSESEDSKPAADSEGDNKADN